MMIQMRDNTPELHPNTWMLLDNLAMPAVGGVWVMHSSDDAEGTLRVRGETEPPEGAYVLLPNSELELIPGRSGGLAVRRLAEWEPGVIEIERLVPAQS